MVEDDDEGFLYTCVYMHLLQSEFDTASASPLETRASVSIPTARVWNIYLWAGEQVEQLASAAYIV